MVEIEKFGLIKVLEISDSNEFCSSLGITENAILSPEESEKENKTAEDSDDDLPSFQTVKLKDRYSKGQIVFSKFKKYPYWPAVFYKMASKAHGYVHFFERATENTKKTIKVPLKNIKHFVCPEREEIIRAGRENDDFNFGMCQADEYLRKRALGKIPSFFDPMPEKCFEDESLFFSRKNDISKIVEVSDFSDTLHEEDNSDDEIPKSIAVNPRLLENIMLSRGTLRNIASGKVFSKRHIIYTKGTIKEKSGLQWLGGYGPLNDQESDTVLETFMGWFREDKFPYHPVSYVMDVWIPEAIIRGIANVNNLSYKDAEKLYKE